MIKKPPSKKWLYAGLGVAIFGMSGFFTPLPFALGFALGENGVAQKYFNQIIYTLFVFLPVLFNFGLLAWAWMTDRNKIILPAIGLALVTMPFALLSFYSNVYLKQIQAVDACLNKDTPDRQDVCFLTKARQRKDVSICDRIVNEAIKGSCISAAQ